MMKHKMIGAKMMKTNGKMNNSTLKELFQKQVNNQNGLILKGVYDKFISDGVQSVPFDNVNLASHHIQQLMSEIGEVLDADKRWKSYRNEKYNEQDKLEELADCFIVLMNIVMFSGFDADDLANAIEDKLNIVFERIEKVG